MYRVLPPVGRRQRQGGRPHHSRGRAAQRRVFERLRAGILPAPSPPPFQHSSPGSTTTPTTPCSTQPVPLGDPAPAGTHSAAEGGRGDRSHGASPRTRPRAACLLMVDLSPGPLTPDPAAILHDSRSTWPCTAHARTERHPGRPQTSSQD